MGMDEAVQSYIDAIAPGNRPLFGRLNGLILGAYPDAAVSLSYGMPSYTVGGRRLYVGAWKHGVSLYGWAQGREAGFTARHPGAKTSKGNHPAAACRRGRHRGRRAARTGAGRPGRLTRGASTGPVRG